MANGNGNDRIRRKRSMTTTETKIARGKCCPEMVEKKSKKNERNNGNLHVSHFCQNVSSSLFCARERERAHTVKKPQQKDAASECLFIVVGKARGCAKDLQLADLYN